MLLGQARGKVGSLVFSRVNGKQVTRSRAEVVKNPRTLAQFIQRVFLNTASQAYSAGKVIFDHSFEGKSVGQESMSEFMSKNLEYMRNRVAELVNAGASMDEIYNYVPVGQSGLAPGAWIVSRGRLPKVTVTLVPYTTIGSSQMKIAAPANTYQSIIDTYGLQRGDQITIVSCEQPLNSTDFYFNYCRIILDPREEDGTAAPLSTAFITDNAITKPNSKNEGNFGALDYSGGNIVCKLTTGDVASAGVIVSRKVNDEWQRSDCQLVLSEDVAANGMFYSLQGAIEASEGVTIDVTNALYLNNAGKGGRQSTSSGGSAPVPAGAVVNNTVSIKAGATTVSQNVSGGTVSVDDDVTKVEITGTDLDLALLGAKKTGAQGDPIALTLSEGNTKATWNGNLLQGETLQFYKGSTLWFSLSVNEAGQD